MLPAPPPGAVDVAAPIGIRCSNVEGISTSFADVLVLVGAGALAGAVGSAGGITSLISYPALLAVGVPALAADVTNIVGLVACWPGSALGSRPELRGQGPWLRRWALVAGAGGAVGSALLLLTPIGVFGRVVPFLLVFASIALLLQPRLSAWQENNLSGANRVVLPCGLFAMSVYNGYFGAGAGVMILALMLLTVDQHLARANALKNMLLGITTVVSAIGFAVFGPVNWTAAAALAFGMFAGSIVGPSITRRVNGNVLRVLVALTGVGLAIRLWISPA